MIIFKNNPDDPKPFLARMIEHIKNVLMSSFLYPYLSSYQDSGHEDHGKNRVDTRNKCQWNDVLVVIHLGHNSHRPKIYGGPDRYYRRNGCILVLYRYCQDRHRKCADNDATNYAEQCVHFV